MTSKERRNTRLAWKERDNRARSERRGVRRDGVEELDEGRYERPVAFDLLFIQHLIPSRPEVALFESTISVSKRTQHLT